LLIACLGAVRGRRFRANPGRAGERGQGVDQHKVAFRHGVGHVRLDEPSRHLFLPEIEIAAREQLGVRRVCHGADYNRGATALQNNLPQSGIRPPEIW
jgi:hypothetical protein